MSRIDCESRIVWRSITAKGRWWTVPQLVAYWRPTFSLADLHRHCAALTSVGALSRGVVRQPGVGLAYVYGYTPDCIPLPGDPIPDLLCESLPSHAAAVPVIPPAAPARTPLELHWTVARAGALDHLCIT